MRGFMILCLISLAVAAPEGYRYGTSQPNQHYGQVGSSFGLMDEHQELHNIASGHFGVNSVSTAPVYEASAQTHVPIQYHHQHHQHQQLSAGAALLVSKNFFIHSAPEEEEEEVREKYLTIGTPRKNYNVVFIKAPVKSSSKTSIKITPAVNEDKTVIYVLAKKPDEAEIHAQVHQPATTTARPEVYFIKYKTAEEAAHAQQSIQAQYDHLGGSTQVSNEGISPVKSVIGVLDGGKHAEQHEQEQYSGSQQSASSVYLPPHRSSD